jgi:hypothetical protein
VRIEARDESAKTKTTATTTAKTKTLINEKTKTP